MSDNDESEGMVVEGVVRAADGSGGEREKGESALFETTRYNSVLMRSAASLHLSKCLL